MKKFLVIGICLASCPWALGKESGKEAKRLDRSAEVINEIMQTPEKGIPRDLLNKAVCVGVIPSELKFAFGVGGNFGRGVLVCRRGGNGPWGAPSLFTLGGGSFGFQIGGSSTDIVFIVMNPGGARKLIQSKVELGADASVAAGPVGRSAAGATDAQMHAEILSYSRSRGLFAGVALKGAVLKQDGDSNEKLYGRKLTAKEILIEGKASAPAAGRTLDRTLAKYSPRGGAPFSKA